LARVAVAVVFWVTGAAFATWASRVPAVQERLGLSNGALALALVGLNGGAFLALPAAGGLVRRYGSRAVLGGSLGVYLAALPLLAAAGNVLALACALFVFAAGNSGVDVTMNTQAVLIERAYGKPALGSFHAMFSLGGLGGAVTGSLLARAGWPVGTHFLSVGAVLMAAAAASIPALLADQPGAARAFKLSLPGRSLAIAGLLAFCALMAEGVVNDWSAVFMREVMAAGPGTAAAAFAAFSLGMAAGRLISDRARSLIGSRAFIAMASIVAGLAAAVSVAMLAPAVGVLAYGLVGFGLGGILPVVFSETANAFRTSPGPAIAAVSTVGYTGFVAGPLVVGGVAAVAGLRRAVLILILLMAAISVASPHLGGYDHKSSCRD
jgi:MFS family permease